ncbi:hypothetical protein [Spirosoma foliorum]|uniref:Uncharacterized protein n=1 Tax=Spirosoma foliorum TaxID=2710596 RepID=A0A7G5GWG8_9BACT|nr:hypothetical protein [Spirosoma foliorum]QMW03210.1 hypothetical protein H3H32_35980 [Spirosoma foliorum]
MEPKFVFWDEINKPNRYDEVIPDRKLGMVVLGLYDRIKNNTLGTFFKHTDIEAIYWEINPVKERKPHEHAQNDIEWLKHYFLSYDSVNQEYHLRDFAHKFGNLVYTLLEGRFKPTQVEQLCTTLLKSLKTSIVDKTFKSWYTDIFEVNHSKLRRQLDLLDEKISELVKDLGLQRLDDEEVLQMLRSVSERLDQLIFEYGQLNAAYRDTRFIRGLLTDYQFEAPDEDLPELERAITFFVELRRLLDAIRERLDRIQPKIQQLFGVFQQANFRARTEQFIRYMLDNSVVTNNKVVLPTQISSFTWRIHKPQIWYFDVNRELFPAPPQPRIRRMIDETARQEAFQVATESARRQDKAQMWLDQFHAELEKRGALALSDYFPRVFNNDPQRFDIALRFCYLVLRQYSGHTDWQLDIQPPSQQLSYPDLLLWNMQVYRKNSDLPSTMTPNISSPS